LIATLIFKIF